MGRTLTSSLRHCCTTPSRIRKYHVASSPRRSASSVAGLVEAVTDDKSSAPEVRKELQVEHAREAPDRVKILKLADKTSNLRSLAASPPRDWSVKRRLEYIEWSREVAEGLTGLSEWLEREFEQAAKEAERSTVVSAAT